jgi:hypothetical protein
MRIILTSVLLVIIFTFNGNAQSGANFYVGLNTGKTADQIVTKSGEMHYGYLVGLDARLAGEDMYFIVGGQYGTLSLFSEDSASFFSGENKLTQFKLRIGIGLNIVHFSENIRLRTKALGSFDFISKYDESGFPDNVVGYEKVNDGYFGAVTGLGLDIGIFTIDLEVELAVLNAFYEKSDTKYNAFSLTGGVRF